ncbi:CAP domain-containing protein [Pelotomaculum terephthalicicum JT]|uniref:CAP domain-containing protein n=1 Tax=Pelotomaculum terephthalicicum TaxID=206393 RepID=UPI001F04095E|nr:CAP domain-containing protein [Pelotomaculum terephthalicicum]MCG9966817.1 CAP domain-containing protein [Pelotomaculum terephthalicicum JT]
MSDLSADEKLLFDLVNQEREKAGLPAFFLDMRLVDLARKKSEDMFINNYFNHRSPVYGLPLDMLRKAGVTARAMGAENIAKAATTRRAHEMIMDSGDHRPNVLNTLHDSIGVGVCKTRYGVVVTQLFIGKSY